MWKLIHYSRYLPVDLGKIVDAVIQRNAFFAHQENLLLAMMTDEMPHVRKLAFKRVLAARSQNSTAVRTFRVPELNFLAESYYEMINWFTSDRYEPPLARCIAQDQLKIFANNKDVAPMLTFPELPNHTHAVEKFVRLVTEACGSVCEDQRDGFIRSRIESRSIMHQYNKKSDYNCK